MTSPTSPQVHHRIIITKKKKKNNNKKKIFIYEIKNKKDFTRKSYKHITNNIYL